MRNHTFRHTLDRLAVPVLLAVSVVLLVCNITLGGGMGDTDAAARRVERMVSVKMTSLDVAMDLCLKSDEDRRMLQIPEDLVVYKYSGDTLVGWHNQFTVSNDDITTGYRFQVLSNPRAEIVSPLAMVGEEPSLMNMGSRWYLVKSRTDGDVKVIGGLVIMDEMDRRSYNGVNPHFRLGDRYSIRPLTYSGGTPVSYGGMPQFKVLYDSMETATTADVYVIWLSLAIAIAAMLLFLSRGRTLRRYLVSMAVMLASVAGLYFWGFHLQDSAKLFSPALYADGGLLYSLGAMLLVDLAIVLAVVCTYMVRNTALRDILSRSSHPSAVLVTVAALALLTIAATVVYTFLSIRSIVLNSGICLELYKLSELDRYSILVYTGLGALLMTIPLLLQMARPGIKALTGLCFDAFSATSRTVIAILFASLVLLSTSVYGLRREQDRQVVWANRLAVERDLGLEVQLLQNEGAISGDMIIAALASLDNGANSVLGRIAENYMSRLSQDYDMSVFIVHEDTATPEAMAFMQSRMQGEPISPGSHFVFHTAGSGRTSYTGHFVYYVRNSGLEHVLVDVEAKTNRADKGYSSLLGLSAPGRVVLPSRYSYARYYASDLVTSRGKYSYPNRLDYSLAADIYGGLKHYTEDGYLHFVNIVSDDTAILISRPKMENMYYFVSVALFALLGYMLLTILAIVVRRRRVREKAGKSYYKSRVTMVLIVSLVLTLISMAAVSVIFVYRRNDANMKAMMTDKVSSLRAILESSCENAQGPRDLSNPDFTALVDEASNMLSADISLYTTQGKVFYSTTPEIFDRSILGSRMDEKAFNAIVHRNRRYFIQKEKIGNRKYFSLYAPVYNASGSMVCIMKSPYTDENFDFEMDAILHFATIFVVFLLLLIVARFAILKIVGRLFKPLEEMSSKMNATDVDSLEYIQYDNDDEISSLVTSYNSMVKDLSESTRQLAQAERDKAWSGMARQVAHEIKNPLTPMKLQLQRLIRLKEKGAPGWEDKFDDVVKVVLDHIDVLTDTANEFSTFAKLYSEDPVTIDVDALLQEEIAMFDGKDNIDFEYFGLDGATIMGPKPQLTRVFVNLLTNSVQAIDLRSQEAVEDGSEPMRGRIAVSLRNSSEEGYYDIVFEDNGPGVGEDNQDKLFTPNFTTKSSGTGLGLAICRSILEKCDATIQYSRSFALGGACFSIHYPKNSVSE